MLKKGGKTPLKRADIEAVEVGMLSYLPMKSRLAGPQKK